MYGLNQICCNLRFESLFKEGVKEERIDPLMERVGVVIGKDSDPISSNFL